MYYLFLGFPKTKKIISLGDQTVIDLQIISNTFDNFLCSATPEIQSEVPFLCKAKKKKKKTHLVQKKKSSTLFQILSIKNLQDQIAFQ